MGKARVTKTGAKGKRNRRRKSTKAAAGPTRWVAVIAVAMCVLLWLAYTEFNDRHWSAFKDAGDRAFSRGNYAYAERMYNEALQEAKRLDPNGEEVVQTLVALSHTHKARGEQSLADAMLARARAVRARRRR